MRLNEPSLRKLSHAGEVPGKSEFVEVPIILIRRSNIMAGTGSITENNEILSLKTKAFVSDLLASVNIDDSIREIISYILEEVGKFTHSDMVCIYEAGAERDRVDKAYQWKSSDNVIEDEKIQMMQERGLDDWIDTLKLKKLVLIENRESVRDSFPLEYARMEKQGINTFLLIPLYIKNRTPSCMCLINPDLSEFALLELTWLYLGQEIGLYYNQERINRKYLLFMEGTRSSNLSEFLVDYTAKRYEALRITRVLSNVIPEEGEWEWIRQFYASIIKPGYREEFLRRTGQEYMQTFLCTEQNSFSIDLEREVNGNNTWFRLEFSVVSVDENGHLERFVVLVKDITQMKKEEEEQHQMITALSSFYKVSFMIDVVNGVTQVIKHTDEIKKYYPDGMIPHNVFLETFSDEMVEKEYNQAVREFMDLDTMEQRMKDADVLSCEYHGKQIEWGRIVLAPAKWDQYGRLEKVVFAVQDITEQKTREEWLQYKMEHDELTGALNRTAFSRVSKLLESSMTPFALVLLDIDKFKSINDTFGHDVGDLVLSRLVSVLDDEMRAVDKVFRLGGDEFAVIMNRITSVQADLVKQAIDNVNDTIMSGTNELPPFSISAGVTFTSSGYNETVYHNADKALYRTKETTHKGCTIFEEMVLVSEAQ
ncbi:MAG: diguanylate cyclase domain-containing protein [Oscillospiraceae bacterium]